jgi:hypothetical protein
MMDPGVTNTAIDTGADILKSTGHVIVSMVVLMASIVATIIILWRYVFRDALTRREAITTVEAATAETLRQCVVGLSGVAGEMKGVAQIEHEKIEHLNRGLETLVKITDSLNTMAMTLNRS